MASSASILMLLDNPLISDQRVEKEARSLVDTGFQVTIVATDEDNSLPEIEHRDGYQIERLLGPFFKHPISTSYKSAVVQMAESLVHRKFKILHCHDFLLLPLAREIKKKRPDVFLLYDSHEYLAGWPYHVEIPNFFNRMKGFLVRLRMLSNEQREAHLINAVITPSKAIGLAQKKRLNLRVSPIVIRNIPNPDSESTDVAVRATLNIPANHTLFAYSGNVHQSDKEIDALIEGLLSQPKHHLIFFGNRPRHATLKQRLFKISRYANQIHFMDLDNRCHLAILSQCDVGIAITETKYQAHRIGSSNRIMEYTLSRLPVIASQQESHEELAAQFGHVVLFDPKRPADIQEAGAKVLDDYATYKTKASKAALQLSWENEVRPLLALYRRITM